MRNLQEQVKKASFYQKLFWPFIVWINCSSDLKNFTNSQPSASNFKSFFSITRTFFFLTVGQNNFGNKIPLFPFSLCFSSSVISFRRNMIWWLFVYFIIALTLACATATNINFVTSTRYLVFFLETSSWYRRTDLRILDFFSRKKFVYLLLCKINVYHNE